MRFPNLSRRRQIDNDLDEELNSHLQMAIQDRIDGGESPDQARLSARREFGNQSLIRETTRSLHRSPLLDQLGKDLIFAARILIKNRTFSLMSIAALALGIGANTAVFAVVNAVLLRPLPLPHSPQLMELWDSYGSPNNYSPVSYPNFLDWRCWNRTFSDMAAYRSADYTLTGAGQPAHLQGVLATANLFRVLGVHPALGRDFLFSEDRPYANRGTDSIILSNSFWKSRFGSDSRILGRTLHLDDKLFTVVGVMPPGFNSYSGASDPDFWITAAVLFEPAPGQNKPVGQDRGISFLSTIGRLKPGVTLAQAQSDMDRVAKLLMRQYPKETIREGVIVQSLHDAVVGDTKFLLILLFGAAAMVFLLVCTDVAGLSLSRITARQHELTIRAAIGASRWHIVRQLVIENAVLAAAALLFGLGIATAIIRFLQIALDLSANTSAILHPAAFIFPFGIAAVATLLFSLAPAREALRLDVIHGLKEASPSASASRRQLRLQNILIIGQISLTMLLLTGCGLFTATLIQLQHVDLGFRPNHVIAVPVDLPDGNYTRATRAVFRDELLTRLRRLPQIDSAGIGTELPLDGTFNNTTIDKVEGRAIPPDRLTGISLVSVSPGYFQALGIPLNAGRTFTNRDTAAALPVVVLNETAARQYFGHRNPVGKQVEPAVIEPDNTTRPRTIVGIAKDVKVEGPGGRVHPMIYWPTAQIAPGENFYAIVHTTTDPVPVISAIRSQIRSLDPNLPADRTIVLSQSVQQALSLPRHYTALLASFAILAVILTAIGLYGVISYATAQRTQEIGIRMALGATPAHILQSFLRKGLLLASVGIAIGLPLSIGAAQLLGADIFGIPKATPLSLTLAAIFLVLISMSAVYIPARRGARVDPLAALRRE